MGKLTFKGEKKKKRKALEEPTGENDINPKKPKIDILELSGWTSCISEKDLEGPCIFVSPNNEPNTLFFDADNDEVSIYQHKCKTNENAVNFLGDNEQIETNVPQSHKVEPSSVNQVFTIVPISQNKSLLKEDEGKRKFAIRNYLNKYLAVNSSSSKVETTFAINDAAIFELKKEITFNGEFKINEVQWHILSNDGTRVICCNKNDVIISSDKTVNNNKFVIRIQMQNSSKYKLAELMKKEEADYDVKRVIKELYEETSGKIKVTEELIRRIKRAIKEGNLNEQIIEEKELLFSRW